MFACEVSPICSYIDKSLLTFNIRDAFFWLARETKNDQIFAILSSVIVTATIFLLVNKKK